MPRPPKDNPVLAAERNSLIILALLSLVVGTVSGLVCALFRLTLQQADWLRGAFMGWAHREGFAGLLLVVAVLAADTALAARLVRRFSPDAAGSGIPQVEEALKK
jgi:chloride channel protein, CIC family